MLRPPPKGTHKTGGNDASDLDPFPDAPRRALEALERTLDHQQDPSLHGAQPCDPGSDGMRSKTLEDMFFFRMRPEEHICNCNSEHLDA
eukprot:6936812-Pyramimonas_sp.AAC.1